MNNDYLALFAEYEKRFKSEACNDAAMLWCELGDDLRVIERLLAVASKATEPSVSLAYKEALNEAARNYANRLIDGDKFADDRRQRQLDKDLLFLAEAAKAVRARFMGGDD